MLNCSLQYLRFGISYYFSCNVGDLLVYWESVCQKIKLNLQCVDRKNEIRFESLLTRSVNFGFLVIISELPDVKH